MGWLFLQCDWSAHPHVSHLGEVNDMMHRILTEGVLPRLGCMIGDNEFAELIASYRRT